MHSSNFKGNYNHPGDKVAFSKFTYQPTLNQLRAICNCYNLKEQPPKYATRTELILFLNDNNVLMTFSKYDGNDKRLQGAIIHWMEEPQESTSQSIDSDYSDDCDSSDSDDDSKMDEQPMDENLAGEECFPSNIDVQHEVEVEMVEMAND